MNNFLDLSPFLFNLHKKNLDKNFVEIIHNNIFQTNTNHEKTIVYYHDEVTENHERSPENIINYYFFKNNCKDEDFISLEYHKIYDSLEKEFFEQDDFKMSIETYNSLRGSDWPSYEDYKEGIVCDFDILKEIKNFEKNICKNFEENKFLNRKNYVSETVANLEKREKFLNTLDKNNTVVFVGSKIIKDYLDLNNFKCVLLPIMAPPVGQLISIKNLEFNSYQKKNQYSYFLLNRRFDRYREKIIEELNKNDLLGYGYVTQNAYPYDPKKLKRKYKNVNYINDLSLFDIKTDNRLSFFKQPTKYKNISCSVLMKNTLEVGDNIKSLIQIIVESDVTDNLITEKLFQPFLLKRIPLIIANTKINHYLKGLGFDLFEDIVNLNFDKIDDTNLRIETAVKDNAKILSTYEINNINERLDQNLNLVKNIFPYQYLDNINEEINKLF